MIDLVGKNMISGNILAVELQVDGDDVHALLHWSEEWPRLEPYQKARIIHAIGNAWGDANDDVLAESRAHTIEKLMKATGMTREQAAKQVAMMEMLVDLIDGGDDA